MNAGTHGKQKNRIQLFFKRSHLKCLFPPNVCQQAVHTLIAVQRRYLESLGKLSPAEEDTIWQLIIGQRAEVSSVKFVMLNKFLCFILINLL